MAMALTGVAGTATALYAGWSEVAYGHTFAAAVAVFVWRHG